MRSKPASQVNRINPILGEWRTASILLAASFSGLFCPYPLAGAEGTPFVGKPTGAILTAGSQRVMILAQDGKVLWEYPTALTHDTWLLSSGNILFADGDSATEVNRAKTVVWRYQPHNRTGGGVYSCQRLSNSNTLVAENSTGRILEVNPAGAIIVSIQTSPFKAGDHQNLRMVRKLDNGNYLACHSGARLVKEYSPAGAVIWEQSISGRLAFAAVRTRADTTLVSSLDEIREYDHAGKVVWECKATDLEGAAVHNMTGLNLLANGNLVVGCYQAYVNGEGSGLLEFNHRGKVLWRYVNPGGESTMMPVQLLSPDAERLAGPLLR